ncbi:ATP-dependent helicase HrpB [Halioglobus sp. Uisw_031]|uniref:ATP-dependent helicase HrpB n=1 Tax=Halioglobus sp. Uisw_031 TaxID=3230977 RepID=UPI0039EA4A6D
MYSDVISQLPIAEVLEQLKRCMSEGNEVVLQAPPGAGKTTIVPLELLDQPWLQGRKILVLEPRRMAARAAASRMAQLLGDAVGQTVGYRIRMDTCVSDNTRIEVITEGILTQQLQRDPGLEDVGLVIFDEFHERNLDADLCLALALHGREVFREGPALKLLVMSATLAGEEVSKLLGNAPIVTSSGRQFPVETHYCEAHQLRHSIVQPTINVVLRVLKEQAGSILVFLPGQREISSVARGLVDALEHSAEPLQIAPLYGGLSLERQLQALLPAPDGKRKIVLSTNLAETSLTIEGITVVVDSGLVREAAFDPATGMTRLATRRISRASAEQRKGRAGRQGPGRCYRLWSEQQHERLVAHALPEILQADLAPMALQLLSWGVDDGSELRWLDPPPAAPFAQAVSILEQCGATFRNQAGCLQLTPHGVRLAQMPMHPRLAHMLLVGCDIQAREMGCLLAAILSERNPLGEQGVDIATTVAVLMGESRCPDKLQGWFERVWKQARRFASMATEIHKPETITLSVDQENIISVLLARAYPDRIARLRADGDGYTYQLSNGRSAVLPVDDSLAGTEWLAVAELGGKVGEPVDRIYSASELDPVNFGEILLTLVSEQENVEWDYRKERFMAERRTHIGSILLSSDVLEQVSDEARSAALLAVVRKKGIDILSFNKKVQQWRARVMLLHRAGADVEANPWPDLSDEALLDTLESWLLPYLGPVRRLEDFRSLNVKDMLRVLLPWPLPLELERLVPERWAAPSGSSVEIDYTQTPPVLAVKLQEMFGCEDTPTVAGGLVALQIHLLSPGQQPLQITQDLAGFWRSSYHDVKREMKGRYPKHPWPDDPLVAVATRYTKKRMGPRE